MPGHFFGTRIAELRSSTPVFLQLQKPILGDATGNATRLPGRRHHGVPGPPNQPSMFLCITSALISAFHFCLVDSRKANNPPISQDEMLSFQEAHFHPPAIARFDAEFFPHVEPTAFDPMDLTDELAAARAQAQAAFWDGYGDHDDGGTCSEDYDDIISDYEQEYNECDDDDGLGYYSDGVKRTLTDEQIAIFRHSELEKLRRAMEAEEAKASRKRTADEALSPAVDTVGPTSATDTAALAPAAEDGEIPDDLSEEGEVEGPAPKKRKKNRRKKARTRADGVVIDLRKRTWDVVETGLGSLDYEEEGGGDMPGALLKRRKVSYDD